MSCLFRCELQRVDGLRVDYIGPFGQWDADWHVVLRTAPVRRRST